MERHTIHVSYRLNGMRIDHAIAEGVPGLSRRRAKAIIDMGGAYLNKKRIRVASRTVGKGDQIEIEYNPSLFEAKKKEQLSLKPEDILYEDEGVIVINKPAQLPSQATRDQAILHVIPVLEKYRAAQGLAPVDLQLVHRLDKDTTGCLVIAKGKAMMTFLTDQFREKTLEKTYHAFCFGLAKGDFEERCFLSAIQPNNGRVKVMKSGGKISHTCFQVLKNYPALGISLINCTPVTGRSHQIRVHLEKNGLPIIGDKVYGEGMRKALSDELLQAASHQLLHAASLRFQVAPDGPWQTVSAPYPASFAQFLALADAYQS
jgi:RluA family pseudouridine synthase